MGVLDDPVNAGDHLRHVGIAVDVGYLDRDNSGVGGDAKERRAVVLTGSGRDARIVARDDPSQMGAMAKCV
jgi:hypothetical protein